MMEEDQAVEVFARQQLQMPRKSPNRKEHFDQGKTPGCYRFGSDPTCLC